MNAVNGSVPTVEVLYTCPGCGVRKRAVRVPERGEADVVTDWIERTVMSYVGLDHMATSPMCRHPQCDLLLPYADRIGQAVRQ